MTLPEGNTDLDIVEDESGDIDEVLDEEAQRIQKEQFADKQQLITQLQSYKIKVYS